MLPKDEIRIENLEVYAYHGVYQHESENGQTFYINATLYCNTRKAGIQDKLELSTNYGDVCHFITKWMQTYTCKLIETVAEKLAKAILLNFNLIKSLDLEIKKPDAPVGLPFESVSVKINRGWHRAYLSVGSNMGDREKFIKDAIEKMKADTNIKNVVSSELIVTKPYGGVEQEDFLNGVIGLDTIYSPSELFKRLKKLEGEAGRETTLRWGPRTLDLDIIFYDKFIYEDAKVIIPHIDMENRYFVLKPLKELIPNYRHPILQKTVSQLFDALPNKED